MWGRLARAVVGHPKRILGIAAAVAVVLSAGLVGLEFRTSQDTLVSPGSQVFQDNVRYQRAFGGETMLVLITGDPVELFSSRNSSQLQQLEADLRATAHVASVVGPYTALRYATDQLPLAPDLLTRAMARTTDPTALSSLIGTEVSRLTAAGSPDLTNAEFVRFLLFTADGSVRPAQQSAFPDDNHALVVVRIEGNTSIDEQSAVAHAVKDIVARHPLADHEVFATGTPVLLDEINAYLQGGMATLGLIAVAVMIVVLAVAFRVRLRLLPLAIVLIGTAAALGAAVWSGIPLSLVTISGLPIFIGLGVDFAIQVQNRYVEQRAAGDRPERAAEVALSRMARPLTVAMVAAAVGFLALRFSAIPMIQDFGLLLCLGVVILVASAIVIPLPILVLVDGRAGAPRRPAAPRAGLLERGVTHLTSLPNALVGGLLVVGVVVAAAGFIAEGQLPIQTEAERWVSQSGTAVRELDHLREATGFSDEIGFMIEADDVTADAVVAWTHQFATTELQRHPGELLQSASLAGVAADVVGITPSSSDVRQLLGVAPADIAGSLITADRRTANLVFPVGNISLAERGRVVDEMQRDLRGDMVPPPGVSVTPSGLAVIGVELVRGMEANRQTLTLVALGFVAAWLLVRGRGRVHALLPIVPVALAVGVASAAVWALGFELTPLTTVAAPLVIAVATEFSVLLEARYAEERSRGRTPIEAARALPRIARAFVVSGLTLVAGFAVLAASPMPLLREFGLVVAIDVVIALASALVVMPALLRWLDRGTAPAIDLRSIDATRVLTKTGGRP
jgi:hydrophobe/amphiphile efflux-3 (HAE3) family protein